MGSPQTFSDILASGFREAVVILSRDFKIVGANDTFLTENNLNLDDIQGKTCHEVLKSCMNFCKQQIDECPVHEALSTGKPVSITHQDVMIDSVPHHYKIDVYPVTDEKNGETHFLHIARDITNRIEEERLKDSMWMEILNRMEHLYAAMVDGNENIEHIQGEIDQLIEIVPLAVVGWDPHGDITRWNTNAEIIFGNAANEVLGKPFIEFFASGKSQERFSEIIHKLKMGQTEIYSLAENRTASGHIISCEWHHSVYQYDNNGDMSACLSLGQDVTERLSTEKDLGKLAGQLKAILNATGDALVGVNNLRRIILWNPAAEKLFGWLASEVMGREIEMLFPADLQESQTEKFRQFLEGKQQKKGQKTTFETSALRRDSITVPVEITLSSSLIENKRNCFAAFHEVTEKKRTEKILIQSEKMRSLGEMASGVAHDFNNSLTIILGNIKLLKETGVDNAIAEKLDAIEKAAQQGAATIASLQGFSRTTDDAAHKHIKLQALKPLIEEVRNLTRFRWKDLPQKDGYTIEFTTEAEDAPALLINGPDFKEMLTNLIFNAVDAMPTGGHIHLSIKQEEDKVLLAVQDNGKGLSKKEAAHIFDPYFTTKGRGHAGLGLSIAKRFVERYGGSIMVESVKGAGSTFTIEFPLLTTRCRYTCKYFSLPTGGHIHLSIKQEEDKILLTVQDNGKGLSKKEAAHIFDPYFTTKGRGHAGLGLSIAKRFVERYGGSIMVESVKGAGSTFTIEFPLLTTSDPEKLLQTKKHTLPLHLQILLIDDEPLVRNLLRQVLEQAGHTVTEASNGKEGVRCFRENNFDLVITDHGMPVMNGLDAAFRIKKQKPEIPVLLITGWQTETDATFQKPSGIDEFITKPFDLEELLDLIEKYGSKNNM